MNGTEFEDYKRFQLTDTAIDSLLCLSLTQTSSIAVMPTLADHLGVGGIVEGIKNKLDSLTDEQRANDLKILGVLNVGSNHYVPYVFRFVDGKPEVTIADPLGSSANTKTAKRIQALFTEALQQEFTFNWVVARRQDNGFNCGPHCVQTLLDVANGAKVWNAGEGLSINPDKQSPAVVSNAYNAMMNVQFNQLKDLAESKAFTIDGTVIPTGDFSLKSEMTAQICEDSIRKLSPQDIIAGLASGDVVSYQVDRNKVVLVTKAEQERRDAIYAKNLAKELNSSTPLFHAKANAPAIKASSATRDC
ncbi:MAG: hypothetical protein Q7V63_05340 [Gammaproteobacteria bacterium]|nr:hypothetical protein [Gammaproteobacteria bacterium]